MYLILITEAENPSLIGSVWNLDECGETAICICPNKSQYIQGTKINTRLLGHYTSKRLERLDEFVI